MARHRHTAARPCPLLIGHLVAKGVPAQEIDELEMLAGGDEGKFRRLLERKRFGEPNAYLRGDFTAYGRKFKIDRRVYIPDLEATGVFLSSVIPALKRGGCVIDVGTGCGWIAITIAMERPDLSVRATDIHPAALDLAAENCRTHGVTIEFFESYFVDDFETVEPDSIVAVLPYGGDGEYSPRELEERPQMPAIAVFDPIGVLEPQRRLIESVRRKGWNTKIYIEIGHVSEKQVEEMMPPGLMWTYRRVGKYAMAIVNT